MDKEKERIEFRPSALEILIRVAPQLESISGFEPAGVAPADVDRYYSMSDGFNLSRACPPRRGDDRAVLPAWAGNL
jgi:hypothetical protein